MMSETGKAIVVGEKLNTITFTQKSRKNLKIQEQKREKTKKIALAK